MKLQNLPKNMLVQLVSQLQDKKEKEYSEYVVIYTDGSDDSPVWRFHNENEFKTWILLQLPFNCSKEICDNENIRSFLEELTKIPRNFYGNTDHRHTEYCKNKSSNFQFDELLNLFNKINRDFVIMKGKCLTGNTNTIPGFYEQEKRNLCLL